MYQSKLFTAIGILTLVVLLATVAIQVLEMLHYEMF